MSKGVCGEPEMLKDCLLKFFIGRRIGKGAFRHVYELKGEKDGKPCVIKVEYADAEFCNVVEWQVWNAVKDTPLEPWFAPCVSIDLMGIGLVQKRTKPFDSKEEFHRYVEKHCGGKLPAFFEDIHYGNFGIYEDRLVCHDYGFHNFLHEAVKIDWKSVVHSDVKRGTATAKLVEEQLALSF